MSSSDGDGEMRVSAFYLMIYLWRRRFGFLFARRPKIKTFKMFTHCVHYIGMLDRIKITQMLKSNFAIKFFSKESTFSCYII